MGFWSGEEQQAVYNAGNTRRCQINSRLLKEDLYMLVNVQKLL